VKRFNASASAHCLGGHTGILSDYWGMVSLMGNDPSLNNVDEAIL